VTGLAGVLLFGRPVEAHPEPEQIRQELDRVFARPEFSPSDLLRRIVQFLTWLGTLSTDQPGLFWIILVGCLSLLAVLLAHLTWTLWRVFSYRAPARELVEQQRRQLAERYFVEAEEWARAGDYTEAIRLLFLSLVQAFDESGQLLFRPALTNREYLCFFEDRPALADRLRVLVDVLDANWYGQHPTNEARYAECRALYDSLLPGSEWIRRGSRAISRMPGPV
jgi:hypothetical protein